MVTLKKNPPEVEQNINSLNDNMEFEEETIDLYAMFIKLIEKWYVIISFALVGAIIMAVISMFFLTPKYQATAKIYVTNSKDSAVNLSDLQISNYLTKDYAEVFDVWEVHEMVKQKLGLDYTYNHMASMVSVENPTNTRILNITVTALDPVEAMQMANAYAEVSREYIATKMDTAMPSVLEEALAPDSPSSPHKTRNVIIGFVLGALIAMAIIITRFLSDDYIRTASDVEKYVHLPVLGTVMLQSGPEFTQRSGTRKGKGEKE